MTDAGDLFRKKRFMAQYLRQLEALVEQSVSESDLVPLDQTRSLQAQARSTSAKPTYEFSIPFQERGGERFRSFLRRLDEAHSGRIHLWTKLSDDCGALLLAGVAALNPGFQFSDDSGGILVMSADDGPDRVLLEHDESAGPGPMLRVEVAGPRWGTLRY